MLAEVVVAPVGKNAALSFFQSARDSDFDIVAGLRIGADDSTITSHVKRIRRKFIAQPAGGLSVDSRFRVTLLQMTSNRACRHHVA